MEIHYNYYHWGPFLYKTKVSDKVIKKIFSFCKRDKEKDMRNRLAGHIKEEYELNAEDIMPLLSPYFQSYLKAAAENNNIIINKKLKMKSVWVNFMKEGEYNPPHTHTGELSCVLYLQIPDDIKKNNINHVSNSPPPGSIHFQYGENLKYNITQQQFLPEKGDFCIFPAWLNHSVYPFKSKKERISLSANLIEVD